MSFLAAAWDRGSEVDVGGLVRRMLSAAPASGRDAGLALDGSVALGARARTDVHGAPVTARDQTGLHVVLDGRLDNRSQLGAELGCPPQASDADLVRRAYVAWRESVAARLLGEFAFVVWDGPRRQMLCARDRMGTRPLYYCTEGRRLLAATTVRQLATASSVSTRPSPRALARHLLLLWESQESFFEQIPLLKPGHSLLASVDGVATWQHDEDTAPFVAVPSTMEECGEVLRDLLLTAVRDRLDENEPTALWMSGGLDSTTLMCLTETGRRAGHLHRGLNAFSSVFPRRRDCDERWCIEQVAKAYGGKHQLVDTDDAITLSWVCPDVLPDTPWRVAFEPMHARLLQASVDQGCHVTLTGVGADQLLTGNAQVLTDYVRMRRWRDVYREMKLTRFGVRRYASALHGLVPSPLRDVYERRVLGARVPAGAQQYYVLPTDIGRRWGLEQELVRRNAGPPLTKDTFSLHSQRKLEILQAHTALYAVPGLDRTARAFGAELRHPYLDWRVARFILSLPPHLVVGSGDKGLLRHAMKDVLPEGVLTRTWRTSLNALVVDGMRRHHHVIEAILEDPLLAQLGLLDVDRARAAFAHFMRTGSFWIMYWMVFATELWLRRLSGDDRSMRDVPVHGRIGGDRATDGFLAIS
jgi:asparagine synthase (glutamine-hydrolysing)